jgi:hypothetical protein
MIAKLTSRETREIQAIGICDICGADGELTPLKRTYFRYEEIKCVCHSPYHFELVDHCYDCVPKEPTETKIIFQSMNIVDMRKEKLKNVK